MVLHNIVLLYFNVCIICGDSSSFIADIGNLCLLFILISLIRFLSILFIFCNLLSVSLIFFYLNFFSLTFFFKFIYLSIHGCVGSSFLCEGFLQLWQAGATPHCGAQASHCRGLSCCGAQAPHAQAQQLLLTGPAALQHVGSSQTRARTRVPCIGRQTLNHCTAREALSLTSISHLLFSSFYLVQV